MVTKSKIYAAALLQTPLSLAMMEKLRVSTSEPFSSHVKAAPVHHDTGIQGKTSGYYGDPEAECQSFHICANDGNGGLLK